VLNNTKVMSRKTVIKKSTRALVYNKIEGALSDLKTGVKEKKFEKHLKKASKLLAKDINKVVTKTKPEKAKVEKVAKPTKPTKVAAKKVVKEKVVKVAKTKVKSIKEKEPKKTKAPKKVSAAKMPKIKKSKKATAIPVAETVEPTSTNS
jgi:hypothetical protein